MKTEGNFDAFERRLVQGTAAGFAAAASFLIPQLRAAVGVPNPTQKTARYAHKKTKSGRAATHTVYEHGARADRPGRGPRWACMPLPPKHPTGASRCRWRAPECEYMLMLDTGIQYPTHGGRARRKETVAMGRRHR